MSRIASFTMNPFYENTYIVHDKTNECIVIDPGCYTKEEQQELLNFIQKNNLKPVFLVNTHCHIDHVLGNRFIADTFNIPLAMHTDEVGVLNEVVNYAPTFGIHYKQSPAPEIFLKDGDIFSFGETKFEILFTPGHSPASICLYNKIEKYIISGDVLFYDSIGRTDLPGGDYDTLITSIQNKLMLLPDDVQVFAGHMQSTSIGRERRLNPFLQS